MAILHYNCVGGIALVGHGYNFAHGNKIFRQYLLGRVAVVYDPVIQPFICSTMYTYWKVLGIVIITLAIPLI